MLRLSMLGGGEEGEAGFGAVGRWEIDSVFQRWRYHGYRKTKSRRICPLNKCLISRPEVSLAYQCNMHAIA